MRIVVTGATGYIGRHLVERLLSSGHEPVCYALDEEDRALLPSSVPARHILTGNAGDLHEPFARLRPDAVLHLAAYVSASSDPESVAPLLTANVVFGAQVAHAAAASGIGSFINVSSYWVHGAGDSTLAPNTLYAASKLAFERVLAFYTSTSAMRSITLELTDVYGPGDTRRKFLDLVHDSAITDRPLRATPGEQMLSLVHVSDIAAALEIAATRTMHDETDEKVFSIASDTLHTLRAIVGVYESATNRRANVDWGSLPYPPHQIMRPYLHSRLPGWTPRIALAEGLAAVYGEDHARV